MPQKWISSAWFPGVLLLLLLAFKLHLFDAFSSRWTDHDQCTLWAAAVDASQGHFHEPCFYGQDYNTSLESYLALPFILCGMPVWSALPLVTTLASFLIFALTALVFYRKGHTLSAAAMLVLPLCMPVEYHFVSAMPRGFITGMLVAGIGHAVYEFSRWKHRIFLLYLFLGLAFWVNQNSILMIIPISLIQFRNDRQKGFLLMVAGLICGSVFRVFTWWFYHTHPGYVYHNKPAGNFEWSLLIERIQHLDLYFFHATWIPLLAIVALIALALRFREYFILIATLLFTLAFVGTLALERIGDGLQTTFYHLGRMYLPVIWSVAFLLAECFLRLKPVMGRKLQYAMMLLLFSFGCTGSIVLFTRFNGVLERETQRADNGVIVSSVEEVIHRNQAILNICEEKKIDLVVFPENCHWCWMDTYSIPALSGNRVQTLNLSEDRRGWRFEEELLCSDRRFLSMGDACSDGPKASLPAPDPVDSIIHGCYVLQINTNVPDYFRGHVKGVRMGY